MIQQYLSIIYPNPVKFAVRKFSVLTTTSPERIISVYLEDMYILTITTSYKRGWLVLI